MLKKPKTYPIEEELEKLFRELKICLRKATNFFFTIPKRKDDKMIYVLETLAWLLLTFILIWRAFE